MLGNRPSLCFRRIWKTFDIQWWRSAIACLEFLSMRRAAALFRVVFPCLPWKRERETALLLLLRQNRKRNFSRIFLAFVAAERLSNGFSVHYYIATGQSSSPPPINAPFMTYNWSIGGTRGRHRLKNAITCFSAFSRKQQSSLNCNSQLSSCVTGDKLRLDWTDTQFVICPLLQIP